MNLEDAKLNLNNPDLPTDEQALLRCRIAAELIHTGHYEEAREALGTLWTSVGQPPRTQGLPQQVAAEVLLQCGCLSGYLGSVQQITNGQEDAKDLLTQALDIFQSGGNPEKVSETQYELGICYWRIGAYDEARIILDEAAKEAKNIELRAKISIGRAMVEIWVSRYHDALNILKEAADIFEDAQHGLKGRWHAQMALVLRRLATAETRTDYADRAIIEFTAAIFHYKQAKHERYCATNLNNLAMLLYKLGRYEEAHEHLDRAYNFLKKLKDIGLLAQVNETRARVLVAQGNYEEASRIVSKVVETLGRGGEQTLLADALAIKATVEARLHNYDRSISIFYRAINVAENGGSLCSSGNAILSLIEEHSARLSEYEIYSVYRRADNMLLKSQDAEDIARLRACARIVMRKLYGPSLNDLNFHLPKVALKYEARFIEQALREERGIITRAAKRLGITYQALQGLFKSRHKKLVVKRKPAATRKPNT
jgi:tetratricopeptide (TPR) repeat protein